MSLCGRTVFRMNERWVSLDAKRLRAMGHPLRLRLLGLLRMDGPSTATALGRRIGENSANTSWHLRQLAEAGMVVEDTERGNRRERWWAAAHEVTTMDVEQLAADPELAGSVGAYLHAANALHYEWMGNFISELPSWPQEWQRASELSDRRMFLSAEQAEELTERMAELIESYHREPEPGDAEVHVQWRLAPLRGYQP